MSRFDPEEVIAEASRQRSAIGEHHLPAVEWFLENRGMDRREVVVDDLADHLDVDRAVAATVVGHLVSDEVDPVQQVVQPRGGKFVGVIDHDEHDWFYAFDRYEDVEGRQRRAVCAHCVHEEVHAADVAHVTRTPDEYDVETARVALALHYQVEHEGRSLATVLSEDLGVDPAAFAERHGLAGPGAISLRDVTRRLDADPELAGGMTGDGGGLSVPEVDVEPGASLVTGTTIAGNTAWHAGNDGAGSGLDADLVDGQHASDLCCLVQRDPDGNAHTVNRWTDTTSTGTVFTSHTTTATVTATTSPDLAFLTGRSDGNFTLQTIRQNGSTVSPNTPGVIITEISAGDTFELRFHATDTTFNTVTGSVLAGQFV